MTHRFLIGMILMFGFTGNSASANCPSDESVDLRVEYPNFFDRLPIQNQGDYGICYAYAASTMIDFFRNLQKSDHYLDENTNAVDAAETASIFTTDGDPVGGEICDVSNALVKRGYACETLGSLPSQVEGVGLAVQTQVVEQVFMDYILNQKKFEPVPVKSFPLAQRKHLTAGQIVFLKKFDLFMTWLRTYLGSRGFGPDQLPTDSEFFNFIQTIQVTNRYDVFPASFESMLGKKNCLSSSFKMPKLNCEKSSTSSDLMAKVDQALHAKRPVGVDICANFLTNRRYQGVFSTPVAGCQAHAVVVIGKKDIAGQCSYLIRNSWGADYTGYAWTKDQGDIWVSEDALRSNLFGTSILH